MCGMKDEVLGTHLTFVFLVCSFHVGISEELEHPQNIQRTRAVSTLTKSKSHGGGKSHSKDCFLSPLPGFFELPLSGMAAPLGNCLAVCEKALKS